MIVEFPSALTLVTRIAWGQIRRDIEFESVFGSQVGEIDVPLWTALLTPARFNRDQYAEWESILLQLQGKQNQLALWHLDRPAPRGTMRGSMVFNGAHARGADTLNITATGQGGTTLLKGDMLGFGSGITQQVIKIKAPATADGSGNITVTVEAQLRNDFANGAAIVWDKPKALFRRKSSEMSMDHSRGGVDGTPLDLVENWVPA